MSPFVCPRCKRPLVALEEAWQCEPCGEAWPVILGTPLFLSPSGPYVARLLLRLRLLEEALAESERAARARAERDPARRDMFLQQAALHALNAGAAAELRAHVEPWVDAEQVEALRAAMAQRGEALQPLPWADNVRQLVRDWSGAAACEEELEAMRRAAFDAAGPLAGARVLMVGAKSGRFADAAVEAGASVEAIDFSPVLAFVRALLLERPVELGVVSMSNRRTRADTAQRFLLGGGRRPRREVRFVVGDPAQTPWPAAHFDVVSSIFFTDVGPPELLFDEAARVLKPGGRFVHFGPLGYAFLRPEEQFDAESLLERLAARGFDVTLRPEVRTTYVDAPGDLAHSVFDNLVFVGTKRG